VRAVRYRGHDQLEKKTHMKLKLRWQEAWETRAEHVEIEDHETVQS